MAALSDGRQWLFKYRIRRLGGGDRGISIARRLVAHRWLVCVYLRSRGEHNTRLPTGNVRFLKLLSSSRFRSSISRLTSAGIGAGPKRFDRLALHDGTMKAEK